ncbi:ATP phosphoribosyltransferase regulatory subunit [Campylobacter sputorum subsp. bubulus]|uniref:ATP phosphoribosyltransferase regulatory subunit n=1 Tax=Campylobacter sputorum subsp. sputorum TaxID=32024 RepID=A0A381DK26_9BACT|nr:ATP phosphoribosyltransferase regulatory subunit [Campylobacter sputorum]ASM34393.1 ATP phosphoribosyltransferase HisG(S)Z, hetero-octameric short form, regulatory subunit [Campylobacter sputorum aubsp. sputorum RM3237]ASM36061.1 ATP phosphoribosyltransferase HisG(S)Z, hetero-octameric short form, regulatory subunit [Campylobacter sputorum bv. faecalis CCUG 20703]ASM37741.1 ATP phosphoribosyltransferase HisG(S)Z, hetero-octameric short form, regulatory subunit [Campylobacter sputorum bv. para
MSDMKSKIYEHEIPKGSRLYFGKSASLKRKIEHIASNLLSKEGFSEILTPYFSYHQDLSVENSSLIRFSDIQNNEISLRADSTIDVARIVQRRLKDTKQNRWFYIQPVFKYPSIEIYQIGAEIFGQNDLNIGVEIAINLFKEFDLKPFLQISNMEIPKLVCSLLNLDISVFEKAEVEKIYSQKQPWLEKLCLLSKAENITNLIKEIPNELKEPLEEIKELALGSKYENICIAPLYFSSMRYYDKLFFRFLHNNKYLSSGGSYEIGGIKSCGFCIFTDAMIENLIETKGL